MTQLPRSRLSPIRIVLFDAFDTLVRPKGQPYRQYAEEARKYGVEVRDEDVKAGFRSAFRQTSAEHPLYGARTGLRDPDAWWSLIISRTFSHAGAPRAQLDRALPPLVPALLDRFAGKKGYELYEDVVPALRALRQLRVPVQGMRSANKEMTTEPLRMGLATNSDSRILLVLRDLGVGEDLDLSTAASRPPSSSFDAWLSQQQRSEGFEGSEGAEKAEGVEGAEGGAGAGTGTLHERLGKGGATLSYFEGVEKPAKTFFYAAAARNGLLLSSSATSTSTSSAGTGANAADANASDSAASVLYVGDQLYEDYQGARRAGLSALLVRRPGAELSQPAREGKRESGQDNVDKVEIVKSLMDVVTYVRRRNGELEE